MPRLLAFSQPIYSNKVVATPLSPLNCFVMFVPFISKRSESTLFRRKGGGGGGKGGGGGGGKSSGSGSGGRGGGTARSSPISSGGSSKSATSYGNGGGRSSSIPSGQLFAGREAGGGTRNEVVGTRYVYFCFYFSPALIHRLFRQYGSGYPGINQRGVAGLGFPFFFWPVVWGGSAGIGTAAYLHSTEARGVFSKTVTDTS